MSKSSVLKKLAIGAAVAGAAGYIAGVLTAPSEGAKTRKRLQKAALSNMSDVEKQLKELQGELGDLVSNAKNNGDELSARMQKKFGGALDSARDSKDKLREVMHSVRDGKASDKDLKRALQDARHSIEHLKQFLKK